MIYVFPYMYVEYAFLWPFLIPLVLDYYSK